jgi:hypothetical protein
MHVLRIGEALLRTCFCLPDGRVALSGRLPPGAECLATSQFLSSRWPMAETAPIAAQYLWLRQAL